MIYQLQLPVISEPNFYECFIWYSWAAVKYSIVLNKAMVHVWNIA